MSTEDFAMLEIAYLLVLVLVKLKSEEERAEHVWGYAEGGMTRGLAWNVLSGLKNQQNLYGLEKYQKSSIISVKALPLPVLSGTADEQLSWFQQKGLLSRSQNCPSCGLAMRIQTRNDIQDKRRYIYSVAI